MGRTSLTIEEMNTLLIEVESVINARPLTYVEDDQDGLSYALSPSHLINGRHITNTPNSEHFAIVSTRAALIRRYKHRRKLLDQFLNSLRKNYLLSLREAHMSKQTPQHKYPLISVGNVIVLKDDLTKRMFWKLGIVKELIKGRDGHVGQIRAALIKVPDYAKLLRRSITHLIPVELQADENSVVEKSTSPSEI